MAVALDAVSSAVTNGTSLSWQHTCTGTNRLLIVGVAIGGDATGVTTSATYNGVTLSSAGLVYSNNTVVAGFTQVFYLIAPPSGTYTVAVSVSTDMDTLAGALSFTGVDQTTGINNIVTTYGDTSAGGAAITVTSSTGDTVVDMFCSGSGLGSGTSLQALQWSDDYDTNSGASNAAQSIASGASSVTMGYENFNDDWWGLIGLNIIAVSGTSPISIVQWGTSSTTAPLTLNSGVTTGNALVIGLTAMNTYEGRMSPSDLTLGGTSILSSLTQLATSENSGSEFYDMVWAGLYVLPSIPSALAGSTTITAAMTNSNSGYANTIYAWEVSGLASPLTSDLNATYSNDISNTVSLSGSTAQAPELIIGMTYSWNGATAPAGWSNFNGAHGIDTASTIVQTSKGSVTYNPAISSSGAVAALLVSLVGTAPVATGMLIVGLG